MKAKTNKTYTLKITLLDAGSCTFEYENQELAQEQFLMYRTVGIIGGYVIKTIELV